MHTFCSPRSHGHQSSTLNERTEARSTPQRTFLVVLEAQLVEGNLELGKVLLVVDAGDGALPRLVEVVVLLGGANAEVLFLK